MRIVQVLGIKSFLVFLVVVYSIVGVRSQVTYYQNLTTLDSLYAVKDTAAFVNNLDSSGVESFSFWHQYKLSKKLYDLGAKDLAEQFLKASAKDGLVNQMFLDEYFSKFSKEVKEKYSEGLLEDLLLTNYEVTMSISPDSWELIHMLQEIFKNDQKFRKELKRKGVKGKPSIKAYGAQQLYFGADSIDTEIHDAYMLAYKDFIHRDSLNLRPFVDHVLEHKSLPSDDNMMGLAPLGILIIHTAKFRFEEEYTRILKNEIFAGKLEPELYGWYTGMKSEYLGTTDPYRFSNWRDTLEELPQDEIDLINAERKKIGLIRCPATIWDKKIF